MGSIPGPGRSHVLCPHPRTCPWKNYLPWNQSLVPKQFRATPLKDYIQDFPGLFWLATLISLLERSSLSCLDTVTIWACLPSLCLSLKWRYSSLLYWVLFHNIPPHSSLGHLKAATPAQALSWLLGPLSRLPTRTTTRITLGGLKSTAPTSACWLPQFSEAPDHPPRHWRQTFWTPLSSTFPTIFRSIRSADPCWLPLLKPSSFHSPHWDPCLQSGCQVWLRGTSWWKG